ncbi:hypothetical protein CCR85_07765 [Rhodothalassium salexigens]|uniref:DUF3035 domain-containing protein n=1 Tax=Rhodothalassium salexigens TaxID=1086 RepID=UPI0019133F61|nr:DUF3035 domain-containing protein [Rhodothalassium salexigens]MBK5911389.1 hypothetical protein [Rhodothalassium salexigens]MBK5920216.1 hypothetical protein [Rhodothalassium salexigens]
MTERFFPARRRLVRGAAVAVLASVVAACGMGGASPDEFVVVSKPNLAVPPDFELRPPRPGKPPVQDIDVTRQAIQALFPGRTELPPPSPGEQALMRELGEVSHSARAELRATEDIVVAKSLLLPTILGIDDREMAGEGAIIDRVASRPQGR